VRNFDYRRLGWLGLLLATNSAPHAGCSDETGLVSRPSEVGAVGFKLTLPGGVDISKVAYAIKSSAGAVVKSNEVLIGGPGTTFAAKIDRSFLHCRQDLTEFSVTFGCQQSVTPELLGYGPVR